jgi:hypothetical protein
LLLIPPTVLAQSREKLKRRIPEFPSEKLVLNATHTHTAPDPDLGWYSSTPAGVMTPKEYVEFLTDRVADAAEESWRMRSPGALAWGSGYAVISHNRRAVYSDDLSQRPDFIRMSGVRTEKHAAMYGSAAHPKFLHNEGSEDPRVNILFTFDEQNSLTGAVINQSSPAQVTEGLEVISADFWHEVRVELAKRYGAGLHVLPQCSAAGDLSPRIQYNRKAEKRMLMLKNMTLRQDIACRFAATFDELLSCVKKDIRREVVLKHTVRTLSLARRLISDEEYNTATADLAALTTAPVLPAGTGINAFLDLDEVRFGRKVRIQKILARYDEQKAHRTLPMELHVIRVGDVVFATNTFELFLDYGIRIMARSPAVQTFLVQLSGPGDGSYLPTQKAIEGEGYSACLYCNTVGAEGGGQLVEETLKTMNTLWEDES